METVVRTDKIRKEYRKLVAVDDVNLQLEAGDIFGLIGKNGSGKTTLIRMLATVLKPTSGTAQILGYDISRKPQKIKGLIGYLPCSYSAYCDLKVEEYLDFFAGAYKIPRSERKGIINDILELIVRWHGAKAWYSKNSDT
jgi:ABC-2 type transport system ATP-binding protein